jgi:MFS family permease
MSPKARDHPRLDSAAVRGSYITRPLGALFVAEVISTTGSAVAAVALPWFVLITTRSPARMGLVMAAEFVGMAAVGIPSGRVATALGPRRSMLAADLVRAPLVAVIPVLHWLGLLSFPVIVIDAFAVGAFFPAYSSSQRLVLAGLVGDDEVLVTRAGGLLGSVNETASFVGPAVGGFLVALLGAAATLLIDAGSYLAAALLVGTLVPSAPPPAAAEGARGALEGLRFLRRDRPVLRVIAGLCFVEIAYTAMVATLPVVTVLRFHANARLAGWLLAAYGAGSVLGGLISWRGRSPNDRGLSFAVVGGAVVTWPLLFPVPAWTVGLAVGATGVSAGVFFPRFFAALTVRTPPPLRARVVTSANTVTSAAGPVGFLLAGLLLQHAGSALAGFALVAVASALGATIVVLSRLSGDETTRL